MCRIRTACYNLYTIMVVENIARKGARTWEFLFLQPLLTSVSLHDGLGLQQSTTTSVQNSTAIAARLPLSQQSTTTTTLP